MKKLIMMAFSLVVLTAGAFAQTPSPIQGAWRMQNGGVVEIAACGTKLCGKVTVQGAPEAGKAPTNPVGHTLLSDLSLDGANRWRGTILDTGYGRPVVAKLQMQRSGQLRVDGCLGPLCQGEEWSRPNAKQ